MMRFRFSATIQRPEDAKMSPIKIKFMYIDSYPDSTTAQGTGLRDSRACVSPYPSSEPRASASG